MSFGSVEVSLWLEQPRYDAIQRILQESGTDLETVMQARLEEFYRQTVPDHERLKINNMMEATRLAEEIERESNMRISVFRIKQDGQDSYFITERPVEFLGVARCLRQYLRGELAMEPKPFTDCFGVYKWLAENQFQDLVQERMEHPRKIVSVFDIDFDKGEVALVDAFHGWQRYRMRDVSNAAYAAYRKRWTSEDDRQRKLFEHLDGREIPFRQESGPTMQML